jgi:hypothetical protein
MGAGYGQEAYGIILERLSFGGEFQSRRAGSSHFVAGADVACLANANQERPADASFQLEDNPLARMPLLLAPYRSIVATVACHPTKEIVAVGYGDGLVLLVRIPDGAEIMIKPPDDGPISAMGWNAIGTQIGIASEDGQCRVVSLK